MLKVNRRKLQAILDLNNVETPKGTLEKNRSHLVQLPKVNKEAAVIYQFESALDYNLILDYCYGLWLSDCFVNMLLRKFKLMHDHAL